LLQAIKALKELDLEGATKTLITAILLKNNKQYVQKYEQLHDVTNSDDSIGKVVNDVPMSCFMA